MTIGGRLRHVDAGVVSGATALVFGAAFAVGLVGSISASWHGPIWVLGAAAAITAVVAAVWETGTSDPVTDRSSARWVVLSVGVLMALTALALDAGRPSQLGTLQRSMIVGGVVVALAAHPVGMWLVSMQRRSGSGDSRAVVLYRTIMDRFADAGIHGRRLDVLVGAVLAILTIVTMVWFIREPILSDDMSYFRVAEGLFDGDVASGVANQHRLALIAGAALAQLAWGFSATAYYTVPFLSGVGLVVAVFSVGRLFFSRTVAFFGALLLAVNPVFLASASLLLPDWPAMFWFTLGGVGAVLAVREGSLSTGHRRMWAVVSGIAMFTALLTKEAMIGLVPAVMLVPVLVDRIADWRRHLWTAFATLCTLFVAEVALTAGLFGDPTARLSSILDGHVSGAAGGWSTLGGDPQTWSGLAMRYVEMLGSTAFGAALLLAVAIALGVLVVQRVPGTILLAGWVIVGFGFVSLAVVGLDPPSPLLRTKLRYLSMVITFMPLLVVASVPQAWRFAGRVGHGFVRAGSVLVVAGLILLSTVTAVEGLEFASSRSYLVRNGATALSTTGASIEAALEAADAATGVVYVDHRSMRGVSLWVDPGLGLEWVSLDGNHLRNGFEVDSVEAFEPGDVIVLNRSQLENNASRFYSESLPGWVADPPDHFVRFGPATRGPRIAVYLVTSR